jgi:hypothetical protein
MASETPEPDSHRPQIRRNVALLSAAAAGVAVLAVGAMALVVAPALWILRDGAARRRRPRFTNDYVRRTPCTHTSQ